MATYHVELKPYSRGQGVDVMRHLAYVTGLVIYDERTGLTHASGDRNRVLLSELLLPPNAPEWAVRLAQHPADFWNFRNISEDRLNPRFIDDASLYFEYVIALPKELTSEQNMEWVRDLVTQVFHPNGRSHPTPFTGSVWGLPMRWSWIPTYEIGSFKFSWGLPCPKGYNPKESRQCNPDPQRPSRHPS